MYCKKCGQKAEAESNYCTYCGTKLGSHDSNVSPSNAKAEAVQSNNTEAVKPEQNTLIWLWIWIGFHLFALLMSYTGVDLFNSGGHPATDKFWPFVEFSHEFQYYDGGNYKTQTSFKGLFNDYDWSEFTLYVGSSLFVYFFSKFFPPSADPEDPLRAVRREELNKKLQEKLGEPMKQLEDLHPKEEASNGFSLTSGQIMNIVALGIILIIILFILGQR